MNKVFAALVALSILSSPDTAHAQRFGGQFGAAVGFWLQYVAVNLDEQRSFGRDLGDLVLTGARGFVQTERVRLGGGAFDGSFVSEGVNAVGNEVTGGLSGAGFVAEYLVVRQDLEVLVGGMVGGATLNTEERLATRGDVETINRIKDTIFIGIPWVRVGYNVAPFVNTGFQVGYLIGAQGFDGFTLGLDITVGLIP